jgi:DNA-binding NtrC family response regulator
MPPLRERRDDIPLLVHEFIREFSREHQREFKGITSEAMEILVAYDWPGNIRELRNLVESMVVLAPGSTIRPEDIPPEVRRGSRGRALTRPTPALPALRREEGEGIRPPTQLADVEFIFRTLLDLRFDVEDLRREFEAYRRRHPELVRGREAEVIEVPREVMERAYDVEQETESAIGHSKEQQIGETEKNLIVFRPGMTMAELEREAIIATLRAVDGNRRRASEQLGIGERTLYRKLREYEIDA